jgi:hypothetical protein
MPSQDEPKKTVIKDDDILPVLQHYLDLRDPTKSFSYRFFEKPFFDTEITTRKVDQIKELKAKISFSKPEDLEYCFIILFQFYNSTFKLKGGKEFKGNNGECGIATYTCMENIIYYYKNNIKDLIAKVEKSDESVIPEKDKKDAIEYIESIFDKKFKNPTKNKNKHHTDHSFPRTGDAELDVSMPRLA